MPLCEPGPAFNPKRVPPTADDNGVTFTVTKKAFAFEDAGFYQAFLDNLSFESHEVLQAHQEFLNGDPNVSLTSSVGNINGQMTVAVTNAPENSIVSILLRSRSGGCCGPQYRFAFFFSGAIHKKGIFVLSNDTVGVFGTPQTDLLAPDGIPLPFFRGGDVTTDSFIVTIVSSMFVVVTVAGPIPAPDVDISFVNVS